MRDASSSLSASAQFSKMEHTVLRHILTSHPSIITDLANACVAARPASSSEDRTAVFVHTLLNEPAFLAEIADACAAVMASRQSRGQASGLSSSSKMDFKTPPPSPALPLSPAPAPPPVPAPPPSLRSHKTRKPTFIKPPVVPVSILERSPASRNALTQIPVGVALSEHRWTSAVVRRTFGGNWRLLHAYIPPARVAETGYDDFLPLRRVHQPYAPTHVGGAGVWLSPCERAEDWPRVERAFVSGSMETMVDDWLYLGNYELVPAEPLSAAEVRMLPKQTFEHWIRHLRDKSSNEAWIYKLRARLHLRKEGHNNPSPVLVEELLKMASDLSALHLGDYRAALLNGEEKLYTFAMRCMCYETGIPVLLQATQENGEEQDDFRDDGNNLVENHASNPLIACDGGIPSASVSHTINLGLPPKKQRRVLYDPSEDRS
ncbi:hypothetical protein OF83DRAFT_1168634 [Amylostereum chailletii]|nr:hypothetical protein OF83DRAFT_1168634 [Amylostereum chailletii]